MIESFVSAKQGNMQFQKTIQKRESLLLQHYLYFFCPCNSANFLNKVTYKKIALKNCSLRRKNETPCKKKVQFYRQLYADQLRDKIAT